MSSTPYSQHGDSNSAGRTAIAIARDAAATSALADAIDRAGVRVVGN